MGRAESQPDGDGSNKEVGPRRDIRKLPRSLTNVGGDTRQTPARNDGSAYVLRQRGDAHGQQGPSRKTRGHKHTDEEGDRFHGKSVPGLINIFIGKDMVFGSPWTAHRWVPPPD